MRTNYFSTTLDLPATGTIATPGYTLEHQEGYSWVINIPSGDAVGAFTLEMSNNAYLESQDPTVQGGFKVGPAAVWVTITGTSQNVTTGANTIAYNVTGANYRWVRLLYTATSGTATATYYYASKGPQS